MAKIIKDVDQTKEAKRQAKLEKKQLKKQKAQEKKNNKKDVPVLKNPTETTVGKIIIWILLILMALGGLSTVIYLIVKLATRS